jgi:putative PIN family toxin of toxin-antitoxin system
MRSGPKPNNKPRVVLDTNVIVSGLITPQGNEYRMLNLATQGKIHLYLSPFILAEVDHVLRDKLEWSLPLREEALTLVLRLATITQPTQTVREITRKDSDNRILECFLESNADYLVTGDRQDCCRRASLRIPLLSMRLVSWPCLRRHCRNH